MKSRRKIPLVGSDGQPLPERIQRALHDLLPRFNRWFPLQDEAVVTGLLEQAGQRIKEKRTEVRSCREPAWFRVDSAA
jgi:hypothetical protein